MHKRKAKKPQSTIANQRTKEQRVQEQSIHMGGQKAQTRRKVAAHGKGWRQSDDTSKGAEAQED